MRLFITGSTGMVGRNLCTLATKRGYQIIAPSRIELDLTNFNAVKNYITKTKPDIVIHCAGLVGGIKANMDAPYDFCYHNLLLGMNVIQATYQAGVDKLINLGSSCMYPKGADNPIKESKILQGQLETTNEGYALAKSTVARLAEYISSQYGVQYKTLIPCNLYGYWDNYDLDKSHVIPAIIKKIYMAITQKHKNVVIWGDGLARREVLFAEDLADFILFSLQNFDDLPSNINIGTGCDYTIKEYYQIVAKIAGYKGKFIHDLNKPTGIKQNLLDVSQRQLLGWNSKTSLKSGIAKAYKFYVDEML